MKVRWTGESLRLRITPAELRALDEGREVCEALTLPGGGWEVRLAPEGTALSLRSQGPAVQVSVPAEEVARLAGDDCEGVYRHADGLRLMVEKDFPCAHPHAPEAREPATERFAPTPGYLARKHAAPPPDPRSDADAG